MDKIITDYFMESGSVFILKISKDFKPVLEMKFISYKIFNCQFEHSLTKFERGISENLSRIYNNFKSRLSLKSNIIIREKFEVNSKIYLVEFTRKFKDQPISKDLRNEYICRVYVITYH